MNLKHQRKHQRKHQQMKLQLNNKVVLLLNDLILRHGQHVKELASDNITKEYFRSQTIPIDNIEKAELVSNFFSITSFNEKRLMASCKILQCESVTNSLAYAPMSYMPWHTNSDSVGERIYYTYTEGESIFRYKDADGTIKEDFDNIGWTARSFKITDKLLWHTIWTEKFRYAFGFKKHI